MWDGVECRLYEEYHSFHDVLANTAMQPIEEYPCKDRESLEDYLGSARMDEGVDPVSCYQQQHEMQGLYRIQINGEGWRRRWA